MAGGHPGGANRVPRAIRGAHARRADRTPFHPTRCNFFGTGAGHAPRKVPGMAVAEGGSNGAGRRGPDLESNTMQGIALISEDASPLGVIGGVDAGVQNIYVANVTKRRARPRRRRPHALRQSAPAGSRADRSAHARDPRAGRAARRYREGTAAALYGHACGLHDGAHAEGTRPGRRDARELLRVGRGRATREEPSRDSARHDVPCARPRTPAASGCDRRFPRRTLRDRGHARAPRRLVDRGVPAGCARPDHALPRRCRAHMVRMFPRQWLERGIAPAFASLPWILGERRTLPPHVERMRRRLDEETRRRAGARA